MHSGLKQLGKTTDLKWAEFYHSPLPVQIGLKLHFVLFCCLKQNEQNRTKSCFVVLLSDKKPIGFVNKIWVLLTKYGFC